MTRGLVIRSWSVLALAGLLLSPTPSWGQGADALMRLLKANRLPAERLGNVIDAVSKRGGAADLGYLLERAATEGGFPPEVKEAALLALADAVQSRGIVPETDPQQLAKLLADASPSVQLQAVRIAARWGDASFVEPMIAIGAAAETSDRMFAVVAESLAAMGGEAGRTALRDWIVSGEPGKRQVKAAAALVASDPSGAGDEVLAWVKRAGAKIDPAPIVQAFLARQGGAETLASQLQSQSLDRELAQRFLRAMYAVGRSDEVLVAPLTASAGLVEDGGDWSAERMAAVIAEITATGDPVRGEEVFRRRDLTCMNCHAVSGAGGKIGPDLSAIGASSPYEYLINAIVRPEQDVKEVYRMHRVLTVDGLLVAGVMVREDDASMVLRDAAGREHVIPQEDIEDSVEGGSLMPKGLKVLMTDGEFADLLAFLGELGKPGPYAVRSRSTVQRWKVASEVELAVPASKVKGADLLTNLDTELSAYPSGYARVAGTLPLEEAANLVAGETLLLMGEFDVVVPGPVRFSWTGPAAEIWVDQTAWEDEQTEFALEAGRHRIVVRLERSTATGDAIGELLKGEASSVDLTVVGGD